MEAVLLKSNSITDIELIMVIAKKLGIETCKVNDLNDNAITSKTKPDNTKHNFFNSIGIWENRNIDAKSLREEAWKTTDN